MAERVVADRFRLIEPLGRGGMGTVWRAKDEVLGRTVALKEVSIPSSVPEEERAAIRERVLREARAAARLSHSCAVTVYDVLEEGDYTFIAMEMVDSPTLGEIVERDGPLTPEQAAVIGLKLVDTLEAAHAKGIVHRDVKPANVMVSDGSVKLADFGIASVKGDPQLTATGLLLGSPSYMSPEQVSGQPAGPASDLWALGATLFYAVEGKGPFDREGPLPTLMAISKDPVPEPENAGPLREAILGLLDKDDRRRTKADALRSMLEPLVEGSGDDEAGSPDDAVAVPVLPAPEGLGEFLSRHQDDEPPAPREPLTKEAAADRLAALPDLETTREDRPPVPPAVTLPVERPRPAASAPPAATAAPPAHPPSTPAGAEPQGNKNWAVALGALALLLLAILLVPRLLDSPAGREPSDGSTTAARPVGQAPGDASDGGSGQAEESEGGEETEQQPAADQPEASAPDGWSEVALGNTGYSIARPASWSVRQNPLGDGSSVRFNGPQGKYLLVDWTNDPGDDALEAWEQQSVSFASRHDNYEEIRLEEVEFDGFDTAAVWEWTYSDRGADLHAIDFGFADESYGFALNFQTRADDWESSEDEFEAFRDSFGRR